MSPSCTQSDQNGGLASGLSLERAIDHVWTLTAPEVSDRLICRCEWTLDAYASWLATQLPAGCKRH
jgi:hypothetical protein